MSNAADMATEVVKRTGEIFDAAEIVEATGFSRQLVHYYLQKYLDASLIKRTPEGSSFEVTDVKGLVSLVVAGQGKKSAPKRLKKTLLFGEDTTAFLNGIMEFSPVFVGLEFPYSKDLKKAYLDSVDETIKQLRVFRTNVYKELSRFESLQKLSTLKSPLSEFAEEYQQRLKENGVAFSDADTLRLQTELAESLAAQEGITE